MWLRTCRGPWSLHAGVELGVWSSEAATGGSEGTGSVQPVYTVRRVLHVVVRGPGGSPHRGSGTGSAATTKKTQKKKQPHEVSLPTLLHVVFEDGTTASADSVASTAPHRPPRKLSEFASMEATTIEPATTGAGAATRAVAELTRGRQLGSFVSVASSQASEASDAPPLVVEDGGVDTRGEAEPGGVADSPSRRLAAVATEAVENRGSIYNVPHTHHHTVHHQAAVAASSPQSTGSSHANVFDAIGAGRPVIDDGAVAGSGGGGAGGGAGAAVHGHGKGRRHASHPASAMLAATTSRSLRGHSSSRLGNGDSSPAAGGRVATITKAGGAVRHFSVGDAVGVFVPGSDASWPASDRFMAARVVNQDLAFGRVRVR